MAEHEHKWFHHHRVTEEAAAQPVRAVHARLPNDATGLRDEAGLIKAEYVDPGAGSMATADPSDKQHAKMLREKGVTDFSDPPARVAGDTYVCEDPDCQEKVTVPIGATP